MGMAEILVVKEEVLMEKEEVLMEKEDILTAMEEIITAMEEIITKENVVKAVEKIAVKAVAENSIMEEVFMKAAMDSIVAHPIAIGRMF